VTDPTINDDSWRTFKRVLPKDVHEEMKYFEELVATHSGIPPRFQGIGHSVSVWAVICHHLRSTEEGLVQMAKDWKGENQV
jgi:hypothetical protein